MSAVLGSRVGSMSRTGSTLDLVPSRLAALERLMVFNWLPAAYAHRDWLGFWAPWLAQPGGADMRLIRRASGALLDRHELHDRYLARCEGWAWLLLPMPELTSLARTLGVAMLGGWVRNSLERDAVARQSRLMSKDERVRALTLANSLKALPHSSSGTGWPLVRDDACAVTDLGLSCMAAVLNDECNGSRERFFLRLARGRLASLTLDDAQRSEAKALLDDETAYFADGLDLHGATGGWTDPDGQAQDIDRSVR